MWRHNLLLPVFATVSCLASASAFAFTIPDDASTTSTARRTVASASTPACVAHFSALSIPDVVRPATREEPTRSIKERVEFFEQQLDACADIVDGADRPESDRGSEKGKIEKRFKFKEHPRCTARFGDVLLHARDFATTNEEYENAVANARSVTSYVDACRGIGNDSYPIREGLVADVADALTTASLRKFRVRQVEDGSMDAAKSDFTLERADLEILGRLYYSAIQRNAKHLGEVGLTLDHGGFTALLALCRAASESTGLESSVSPDSTNISGLAKDGARLDAALSNHFNGITAPGCRFLFSPRHGVKSSKKIGRAKRLVVAFSSLGNGLVRHEFGGSLAKLNNQLQHVEGEDVDGSFDVLFVADPAQSWYQKDSHGDFGGFGEYERRIRAATKPYDRVSLVGDSMGGSGSLLFSHLATESVVAFSPQVNLYGDAHVSRCDMTPGVRYRYFRRLVRSVEEAAARRVKLFVHRGVERTDVEHTDRLVSCLSGNAAEGCGSSAKHVKIIEHADCSHHQIAVHLKKKGQLAHVLSRDLIEENE